MRLVFLPGDLHRPPSALCPGRLVLQRASPLCHSTFLRAVWSIQKVTLGVESQTYSVCVCSGTTHQPGCPPPVYSLHCLRQFFNDTEICCSQNYEGPWLQKSNLLCKPNITGRRKTINPENLFFLVCSVCAYLCSAVVL